MASRPASRKLEIVVQRFFALSTAEQLDAYRTIRDYLGERVRDSKRDRVVAKKQAALGALAKVAAHLGLPAGQGPTPKQFDAGARELNIGWDRSRVRRAWGRWSFAVAAFVGDELPQSARQEDRRRRPGGQSLNREAHLAGVQRWLATKPEALSPKAYERWAREYNESLASSEVRLVTSPGAVGRALQITWPDIVRLAHGEISKAQARPRKRLRVDNYCRGQHQLVSRVELQTILGRSPSVIDRVCTLADFPAPVIVLANTRLWLRDHIEAFRDGRRWTLDENAKQRDSLRDLYLTIDEVAERIGLNRDQIRLGLGGAPPPVVRVSARVLWLRSEVESWTDAKGGEGNAELPAALEAPSTEKSPDCSRV